jgi:hypothetical protein
MGKPPPKHTPNALRHFPSRRRELGVVSNGRVEPVTAGSRLHNQVRLRATIPCPWSACRNPCNQA